MDQQSSRTGHELRTGHTGGEGTPTARPPEIAWPRSAAGLRIPRHRAGSCGIHQWVSEAQP